MIAISATLGGLPAARRARYLAAHGCVEAHGDQGRHVERLAHTERGRRGCKRLPRCWPESRVIGRQAGEARGAFVLEGAELGHLDQQGERAGLADAGDAHEDGEARLQGGIGG